MTNHYALIGTLIAWHLTSFGLRADTQATTQMPSLWKQDYLTGDWGGTRTKMTDNGVVFGLQLYHDVMGNPTGGIERGLVTSGGVVMSLNLDFEKMTGLKGSSFYADSYYIYGPNLTFAKIGNIMPVNDVAVYNSLRLHDLWYQQEFLDGKISLRVGQIAADDEFLITNCGLTFINGTFTWAPLTANNLPSAGPGYPLATPGARLKLAPIEQFSLMAAVFDGDPADSQGTNNPYKNDASGTRIDLNQGALSMFEAAYLLNQEKGSKGLPGTYTLGGFYATKNYLDVSTDDTGLSLADPASTGAAKNHSGNWGIYFMADQVVWRKSTPEPTRDPKDMKQLAASTPSTSPNLDLFWRVGGAPSDRNFTDFYTDGGLNYTGLFPDRDQDVLGLGVAYTHISSDLQQLDRESNAFTNTDEPIRDYEIALELTYMVKIAPWWIIQPDVQYIIHPGGNIPNPNDPSGTSPIPDALVLGLRTVVTF